jgi:flavin reductase (DIM6/NTAB) family NADH-FMN oxidoreductase RutF
MGQYPFVFPRRESAACASPLVPIVSVAVKFMLTKVYLYETIRRKQIVRTRQLMSCSAEVDFDTLTPLQRYKLMASLIVPRPIALVTSLNAAGVVNAAPFSLFNMVGEDPPLIMLSINKGAAGQLKDTASNILAHREFVVHLVDENGASAMHACGAALPSDVSEVSLMGLSVAPSSRVSPPRLEIAPVAFECVLTEWIESGTRQIFFGRVLCLHTHPGLLDLARHYVDLDRYFPVGRFGSSLYVRTRDRFEA